MAADPRPHHLHQNELQPQRSEAQREVLPAQAWVSLQADNPGAVSRATSPCRSQQTLMGQMASNNWKQQAFRPLYGLPSVWVSTTATTPATPVPSLTGSLLCCN